MKKLSSVFKFLALLLGLGAIVLAIVGIAVKNGDTSIQGTEVFFGATFADLGILGSAKIKFNIIGVVVLVAILLGTIFGVAGGKIGAVIGAIFLIGGGVALFLLPGYTNLTVTVLGKEVAKSLTEYDFGLGWGLISGASLSCVSGIFCALGILK